MGPRKPKKKAAKNADSTELQELLSIASQLMEYCQPEAAVQHLEQALLLDGSVLVIDALAEAYLENGEIDKALQMLTRSIEIDPEHNHVKYFSLAQIQTGMTALDSYNKGIAIINKLKNVDQIDLKERELLDSQLCAAYCSQAEIYTTDCCDMENAEPECDRLYSSAILASPQHCEGHQGMASLRLLQGRADEAKTCMTQCFSILSSLEEQNDSRLPSYDFRIITAKQCIECEMFEEAAVVLDRLLYEDDSVQDVWFLIGFCYQQLGEHGVAKEYLSRLLESFEANPHIEMETSVKEMIASMDEAEDSDKNAIPDEDKMDDS